MIRVVLVDDHGLIRDGIRSLLYGEPDLSIVGEAANGQQLLDLLAHTPADVVLLDLNMPVLDGLSTLPLLRQHHPQVHTLVLSMLDHEQYVVRALQAGARGYALKNTDRAELLYALHAVARGQPYLCTAIGLDLLRKLHQTPLPDAATSEPLRPNIGLSKRELEVLRLIAEGLTNAEMAERLFTSKRTVETHRQNLIEKTQAKNTAALVRFAVENGLLA